MFGWVLSAFLIAGCAGLSGSSKDRPLASRTVPSPSESRVRLHLIEVFEGAGFTGRSLYGTEIVFEREGSLGSTILYGSWLSGKTVERVRLRIRADRPGTSWRIDCRAFSVVSPGDTVMEEEHRIHRRGSYVKLLEEVGKRLQP